MFILQFPEQGHPSLTTIRSCDSKDTTTSSPDEGIGDSLAHHSSTSTAESKRSDSCDTDKNIDPLKSESDDMMELKNIIVTQVNFKLE